MAAPSVTDYVLYGAYAGEGLAITIGNGLLLLTILLEKSLRKRKEMRIIAVLCIADLVYGFGGLLLNGYRILLMAFGLNTIPSTAWDCIKWPHSFLAQIGGQLTAFMNLAVSVDRLICVTFPVAYHKFGSRYATIFISAFFAYFFLSGATMLLSTYFQAPIFSKFNLLCVGAPFAAWYVLYHYTFIVVAGALDVIVYLGVFFSYR
uniref:G-protein coupled receptors family 1 profile domain-containing protein n=1 Tax=Plectus sambesii TaxID=2011161 RepID=A0A914W511_9BILA